MELPEGSDPREGASMKKACKTARNSRLIENNTMFAKNDLRNEQHDLRNEREMKTEISVEAYNSFTGSKAT